MIRINLLPESYRRAERTSPKVFLAALAGVVFVCASLGWFGMVYFGDLERVVAEHATVAENLTSVNERASLFDSLVNEEKEFSKRKDTIIAIAKGRRLWTKFMDELITVITNEGDYDRHVSWFGSVSVRGSRDPRRGPTVILPGNVQGEDLRHVANLHEDVEATPFAIDVPDFPAPSGQKVKTSDVFPKESFSFSWTWQFKSAAEWQKNVALAPKPAK